MRVDNTSLMEARRVLTICTVCDYCSGFCEMFRAAGRRSQLLDGDITYLAHLCHDCGNCLDACQYAPPHVFQIDPPDVLGKVRAQMRTPAIEWFALTFVPLTLVMTLMLVPADVLFALHSGPGAFYAVLPWRVLCLGAGIPLVFSLIVVCLGVLRFWRNSGGGDPRGAILSALRDIVTLRNLRGGGIICAHGGLRRWAHHLLVSGFGFCFASTLAATFYHHVLDRQAPYPFASLPVVLGSVGGGLMLVGCAGLWWAKRARAGGDHADGGHLLLSLFFMVVASGFAVLIGRETTMMSMLLAVHFGAVLGLFLSMSVGKLAHGAYRAAALLRAAMERGQS